ncbi:hypothetical protein PUR32_12155, partial [Streptomyces sp. BE133]|nr:hypothetical protein [Streptomyces sp. BE133]
GKLASRKCLADCACWKPEELPSSQVTRHFLVSRRVIHRHRIGGSRLSGIKALLVRGQKDGWWHFEVACVTDAWRDA